MRLFAARTITLGFILAFTHLVTTPAPVLCSHDCGDVHVMGAAEHIGHGDHGDHGDHDADHAADGHGCKHHEEGDAHGDAECVDVTIVIDALLPSMGSTDVQAPVLATLTRVPTTAPDAPVEGRAHEHEPAPPQAPLEHLGRLLI